MFCPKCRDEFRPGFTQCPDCMVALVDSLPAEGDEDEEVDGPEEDEEPRSRTDPLSAAFSKPISPVDEEAAIESESEPPKTRRRIDRPAPGEYWEDAERYIALIPPDVSILDFLADNIRETEVLALSIGDEALARPYGPGKWSGKELLVHVGDDERIFAYRALAFARGDATELPGFEEKDYAAASRANARRVEDIVGELLAIRMATIELFDGLDDEALLRSGIANGKRMSVRGAAYHICGHELHHARILRAAYP